MEDARPTWMRVLDLAERCGRITADRKAHAASTLAGRDDVGPATLAEALGEPVEAVDALFRLERAPLADAETARGGTARCADDLIVSIEDETRHAEAASPQPVELRLEAIDPPGPQWRFTGPCVVLLGRSQRANVRLEDTHVTGCHAEIEVTPLGCRILDRNSSNHTYVNGERVEVRELLDGDEIRIGRTRLKVHVRVPTGSTTHFFSASLDPEIPGYVIERPLGRGAQGQVFLARELATRRAVAIKTFSVPYSFSDEQVELRAKCFLREMATASLFHHPHVVEVNASGLAGRTLWMAMEHMEGGDLGGYLRRQGPLPCEVACRFMSQALEGMSAAHERKIIHRDLKPENLLLTRAAPDAEVKVADLGLAKNFETAGMSGVTQTGAWAGTPDYVAPDQVNDYKYATPAADVWSLGAILFRMLAGRGLYDGEGDGQRKLELIFTMPIPRVDALRPGVPAAIGSVVERALQRESDKRYADAREMLEALGAAMG